MSFRQIPTKKVENLKRFANNSFREIGGKLITLAVLSILTAMLLLVIAARTHIFNKSVTMLRDLPEQLSAKQQDGVWPAVSIVVPACNEAKTIEAAAESLLSLDYPNLEVVFVNDRSTDQTGEIINRIAARDPRFKSVHISELPAGWLGKTHAMAKGIEAVSGDYILLTDADVHFSPHALRKAVSHCLDEELDFLTVIPDLIAKSLFLQVMMAQLYHVASLFFDIRKLNDPRKKVCYGQGAFLLLRRTTYARSEGLNWLRMDVIDDSGTALLMRRAGAKMGAVAGRDEISLEWYPSLRTMIRGLEKNGFAICQYSLAVIVGTLLVTTIVGAGLWVFPFLTKSPYLIGLSLISLIVYLSVVGRQIHLLMPVRRRSIVFMSIAFMFLPFIFLRAGILAKIRRGIYWRGTFYPLSDLKVNQRMKFVNLVFPERAVEAADESVGVNEAI